ncbi:MAG: hypothetical protein SFU56_22440 [Capsulimonadales bacterium]|nr:hypothetical protein [Capsulimonadales bacterium]
MQSTDNAGTPEIEAFENAVAPLEGMEAIEQTNLRVPMPAIPQIGLDDLEGKSVFEQFLMVWGTPERGAVLWELWQNGRDEFSRQLLEQLAQNTAEETGLSLEEAKRRLAVEKVLSDVGPDYAIRFLESYKSFVFTYRRPLKPMIVRPRKRR